MIKYIFVNRPTFSEEYKTKRLEYPQELDYECVVCGNKVKYCYPNNGKLVHTLNGDVYQIVNLYICTNEDCVMSVMKEEMEKTLQPTQNNNIQPYSFKLHLHFLSHI